MKIIMPMARLATVSVTQELPDPIRGSMASARIAGSSTGQKIPLRLRQCAGRGKVGH